MRRLATALGIMLAAAVAACGTPPTGADPSAKNGPVSAFANLGDIPSPPGSSLDLDRSVMMGAEGKWMGQLSLQSSLSLPETHDFFRRQMPRFGWKQLSAVRGVITTLAFANGDRIATISIKEATLSGCQVNIVVSPADPTGHRR